MRAVCCPDKFRGSLNAIEAAARMGSAIQGLALETASSIYHGAISDQAVAGYMVISIPIIATAIIKGGEVAFQAVTGAGTMQSAVSGESGAASKGNITQDAVSFDQQQLAPNRSSAYMATTTDAHGTTIHGSGPDADRPAYDVILQAESGLMSLTGYGSEGEREPVRVGVAVIDFLSALYGLSGVLAALVERGVTGRGRRVEVSMIDAGTAFLSYAAQSWLADGRQPPALGSRHPNLAPYQALPTRDGWFLVGVGSQDQWRRFCRAIERPDLETDPRFAANADRVRNRTDLDALLAGIFRERSSADWDAAMRAHRIPAAAPATVGESVERARARGQLLPLGDLLTLAAPWLFDGERPRPWLPPPALGEHTEEILAEIRTFRAASSSKDP